MSDSLDLQIKMNDGNYVVTTTSGDTFITSTTTSTSFPPLTGGIYTIPSTIPSTGTWTVTYPPYPDPQVLDDLIKKVKELEEELKCMKLKMILEAKPEETKIEENVIKEEVNG